MEGSPTEPHGFAADLTDWINSEYVYSARWSIVAVKQVKVASEAQVFGTDRGKLAGGTLKHRYSATYKVVLVSSCSLNLSCYNCVSEVL